MLNSKITQVLCLECCAGLKYSMRTVFVGILFITLVMMLSGCSKSRSNNPVALLKQDGAPFRDGMVNITVEYSPREEKFNVTYHNKSSSSLVLDAQALQIAKVSSNYSSMSQLLTEDVDDTETELYDPFDLTSMPAYSKLQVKVRVKKSMAHLISRDTRIKCYLEAIKDSQFIPGFESYLNTNQDILLHNDLHTNKIELYIGTIAAD